MSPSRGKREADQQVANVALILPDVTAPVKKSSAHTKKIAEGEGREVVKTQSQHSTQENPLHHLVFVRYAHQRMIPAN